MAPSDIRDRQTKIAQTQLRIDVQIAPNTGFLRALQVQYFGLPSHKEHADKQDERINLDVFQSDPLSKILLHIIF